MRILHYTIGFPPERSGGLPRYALDLMNEQSKQGHEVFALYPSRINIFNRSPYIKKSKSNVAPEVVVYELINSLPLPLFGGIKNPSDFMVKVDLKIFRDFLEKINVDVIHVHTLMGLHKEFFEVSKEKEIRIVFTSHDYFGLSPVPNFYLDGKSWDEENTIDFWVKSSGNAMSTSKLRVFQLSLYPNIRKIFSKFKRQRKKRNQFRKVYTDRTIKNVCSSEFSNLRKYYKSIFELVDVFHFNSNIAKEIYIKNFPLLNKRFYRVISITNSSISNRNKKKKSIYPIKNIAYIGPYQEYKGFYDFLEFAEKNKDKGYNFFVFGDKKSYIPPSYIEDKGKYSHSELEEIFHSIDLLLIPSLWNETFGFLTLEALSYGTPVMVSENVGAKALLDQSMVFENLNELVIPKEISPISIFVKTMDQHTKEIIKLYESEEKK